MPKPKAPHIEVDRDLLLAQLTQMVYEDFHGCNGTGSVFCLGCIAIRSVHALVEVYEELDQQDEIDQLSDDLIEKYKGGDPDVENVVTIH